MWPFSDKKFDQMLNQLSTLTQLTLNLGEYVMTKFEDLDKAITFVTTEVKETSDQVKKLRDEVTALKEQLPGITEAELATKLDAYISTLTGLGEKLDGLQDHPPAPKPEEPVV